MADHVAVLRELKDTDYAQVEGAGGMFSLERAALDAAIAALSAPAPQAEAAPVNYFWACDVAGKFNIDYNQFSAALRLYLKGPGDATPQASQPAAGDGIAGITVKAVPSLRPDYHDPSGRVSLTLADFEKLRIAATPPTPAGAVRVDDATLRTLLEREAAAHDYFAQNPDLRMTTGDHAQRADKLRYIAALAQPAAPSDPPRYKGDPDNQQDVRDWLNANPDAEASDGGRLG